MSLRRTAAILSVPALGLLAGCSADHDPNDFDGTASTVPTITASEATFPAADVTLPPASSLETSTTVSTPPTTEVAAVTTTTGGEVSTTTTAAVSVAGCEVVEVTIPEGKYFSDFRDDLVMARNGNTDPADDLNRSQADAILRQINPELTDIDEMFYGEPFNTCSIAQTIAPVLPAREPEAPTTLATQSTDS
jgi:hypothetical protein